MRRRTNMKAAPWILIGAILATTFGASGGSTNPAPSQDPPAAAGPQPARSEDEKAIRSAIDAFLASFAKGDAKAIAAMFTEQGEAIDIAGSAIRGRQDLEVHYAERFEASPGEKLETTVDLVHFLAPEVVRQDGQAKLIPADGGVPSISHYTATYIKTRGR